MYSVVKCWQYLPCSLRLLALHLLLPVQAHLALLLKDFQVLSLVSWMRLS